ncbi:MAG: hypothetical protein RQ754_14730 [Desulfuromonadales bacterium]|nr:hypothetical protein [Desulfuromonadales bacterium]
MIDLPTRSQFQQFFDPRNTDPLLMNKVSQTLNPLYIITGKETFLPFPGRADQALLLIDPQSSGVNLQKLCSYTDGIDRIAALDRHAMYPFSKLNGCKQAGKR